MERQQPSPNGIQRRYKLNPKEDAIIDARLTEYELNNHQSQFYFTGKIYFQDGKEKDVRFFKFKKSEERLAKKIFFQTSKSVYGRVLKAHFATYYEPQELWILCYDWFDYLLDEMQDDNDLKKKASSEDSDILSFWWGNEIRNLLRTIKHIHSHKLFHMGLNKMENYVVVDDQIKIINIQSSFADFEDIENTRKLRTLRIDDLKALRNMLKEKILLPGVPWIDRDYFFVFFDNVKYEYPTFVNKLASHPFLLTPEERMACFRNILHRSTDESELKGILDGEALQRYRNWNRFEEMSRRFRKVYKCSKYDGECVWDLLKFLKDVDLDLPPEAADTEIMA
ncbi:unnamed protein product [Prunus armeniaca]|uniref:Protein kinase domain-containing protein n=1 Tax=Prunus armeniaca TaxID=36596 RepID=A0A6J5VIR3_PRUAR|nr:unnamed protein product [Prunus armeniaca]